MNYNPILNRRQFLRTTGQAATTLASASTVAPAMLSAGSPGKKSNERVTMTFLKDEET